MEGRRRREESPEGTRAPPSLEAQLCLSVGLDSASVGFQFGLSPNLQFLWEYSRVLRPESEGTQRAHIYLGSLGSLQTCIRERKAVGMKRRQDNRIRGGKGKRKRGEEGD